MAALGLADDYVVKFAGGADALWAEIASAKKEERGVIVFNWTPNFTDADGFVFIEFPEYTDGCRVADGGDGACGSPKGWLKKAANYKFPKTHPAAYTALFQDVFHNFADRSNGCFGRHRQDDSPGCRYKVVG